MINGGKGAAYNSFRVQVIRQRHSMCGHIVSKSSEEATKHACGRRLPFQSTGEDVKSTLVAGCSTSVISTRCWHSRAAPKNTSCRHTKRASESHGLLPCRHLYKHQEWSQYIYLSLCNSAWVDMYSPFQGAQKILLSLDNVHAPSLLQSSDTTERVHLNTSKSYHSHNYLWLVCVSTGIVHLLARPLGCCAFSLGARCSVKLCCGQGRCCHKASRRNV